MSDPQEIWKDVPGFPGYQASDYGNFRSLDRTTAAGKTYKGKDLSTRVSNRGYVLVDLRDAQGKKVTRSAHTVILEAHDKPCPPGMEARHLDDDPLRNRFVPADTAEESRTRGGNLFWGTKGDQYRDKVRNNGGERPPVPGPAHDCINHAQCGGKTRNPGKRCLPCVEQVGRDAAAMLRDGRNLHRVAEHFGYKRTDFVFSMAQKHGDYTGTKDDALIQGRKRSQRVTAWARKRLRRGDAASPATAPGPLRQEAKAGTAPFGRVSPYDNLGHMGHGKSQDVTQREPPQRPEPSRVVTRSSRPHVPYPSDTVRYRAPRKPGVTRHR